MKKKLLLLSLFLGGLSLFQACFCEEYRPYFDYKKLSILESEIPQAPYDTMTVFVVSPAEVDYVTGVYWPTVTTAAYGTSCPMPGEKGPKHALTSIDVTADQDFSPIYPAGASLNSLFFIYWFGVGGLQDIQLSKPLPDELDFYSADLGIYLYTPFESPIPGQVFTLHVKISKDNGEVAEGSLSGVTFK